MKADLKGASGALSDAGGNIQEDILVHQAGGGALLWMFTKVELAQWKGMAVARNAGNLWNGGKADPTAKIRSVSGFLPICMG